MLARPSKIVCVGLNYAEHVRESTGELPSEPVIFMKAPSSWADPERPLVLPPEAHCLDYEVELGVVIGREARRVAEAEALDYVAGYLVLCDYSERSWQKERGGQWVKGKSHDGFCPASTMVPREVVPDPQNLRLWTKVNGEMRQDGTTAQMIFPVKRIVSYLSRFMTLEAGDVIATGTPAGVAMGMNPPRFLKVGDVIELGIDGIGMIRQEIVAP
ncbi:MAG: fumarylacetoacetate hydrolase family protein [Verrucomicrobiales bacterium]